MNEITFGNMRIVFLIEIILKGLRVRIDFWQDLRSFLKLLLALILLQSEVIFGEIT